MRREEALYLMRGVLQFRHHFMSSFSGSIFTLQFLKYGIEKWFLTFFLFAAAHTVIILLLLRTPK